MKLLLFLGAGVSVPSDLPAAEDLTKMLFVSRPGEGDATARLRELAESAEIAQLNIVTLNHDTLVEQFLSASGIAFADGFGTRDGDVRWSDDIGPGPSLSRSSSRIPSIACRNSNRALVSRTLAQNIRQAILTAHIPATTRRRTDPRS
jgi:hypothetical protein